MGFRGNQFHLSFLHVSQNKNGKNEFDENPQTNSHKHRLNGTFSRKIEKKQFNVVLGGVCVCVPLHLLCIYVCVMSFVSFCSGFSIHFDWWIYFGWVDVDCHDEWREVQLLKAAWSMHHISNEIDTRIVLECTKQNESELAIMSFLWVSQQLALTNTTHSLIPAHFIRKSLISSSVVPLIALFHASFSVLISHVHL